jgi:uncharacterized membrane protein
MMEMNKQEFLAQLRKGLSWLPHDDIEERLAFYGEMIEDQMEEGASEEEAVAAAGSVDDIVAQTVADTPFFKIAGGRIKARKRPCAAELVLLVLGAPIWLSLIISVFAVILSLYISLWAVIVSLWAVFASLAACSVGCAAACAVFSAGGKVASGVAMLAAGMISAGLAIFMLFGCRAATRGIFLLTKKFVIWLKNCFVKREAE